jgi:hypothetical protein
LWNQNVRQASDSDHTLKGLQRVGVDSRRSDGIVGFHIFAGNEVVLHAAKTTNDHLPLFGIHGHCLNPWAVPGSKNQINSRKKIGHIPFHQLETLSFAQQVGVIDFPQNRVRGHGKLPFLFLQKNGCPLAFGSITDMVVATVSMDDVINIFRL